MRRRTFLQAALARGPRRPNFLFLIADDHAAYVQGPEVTPNLERLASEGARFVQHYCNSPVCTPSRQSFFTGQLPHAAGVTVLATRLSEDKPTLATQLKRAGYVTAVFGKMHFNQPARPGLHGFDYLLTENETNQAWNAAVKPRAVPRGLRTLGPWRPFKDPARIWLNADKLPFPCWLADMRSSYVVREATRFLDEHREKPFALWVSFTEPHSPFHFPIEYRDRFPPSKFPAPRPGPADAWQIPLIFRDLTGAEKSGIAAAYHTSVRFLDYNIGLMLDHLHKLRLDENTLVAYMPDHGYMLGQHGRFEKHCSYDPALRVPLIFRWPGRVRRRTISDLTESVDVPHTILDLLDVDPLPVRHGRSLRPYLEDRRIEPRDHIFSEYLENEEACIRTTRYKFVYSTGRRARKDGYATDNPTPGRWVRLFDLERDPGEFTDIARHHPRLVALFQDLLLRRFRDTHPEAAAEPSREALEWYLRPRDAR